MKVAIDITDMHPLNKSRGVGFYTTRLFESLKKYTNLDVSLVEHETSEKFNVIHYPFFDLFLNTLKVKNHPTLVTIHDVTPLVFSQHYPPGIRGKINLLKQKISLRGVDGIITVSEFSKNDISRCLGIKEDKIHVVYSAADEKFKVIRDIKVLNNIKEKFNLPGKFALYTGGVNWNKNIVNLTQACLDANLDLVLVGKGFETMNDLHHPELKTFKEFLEKFSNNPKVHVLGYLSIDDLISIYNLANLLLFTSHYEGFGLPILEAQACGLPVVTSNSSSLPEIAGQGALFVDSNDVGEINRAILKVISDKKLTDQLIKNGFENVKKYSWQKTAQETKLIYEKFA